MPNKVNIDDILKSLAKKLDRCHKDETWMSYQDFKDALIEGDIYTSDPSIRNAWSRVKGTDYCGGVIPGRTPSTRKMLIRLQWIRGDYGLEIVEENKKKNTDIAEAC